jgi:integrase
MIPIKILLAMEEILTNLTRWVNESGHAMQNPPHQAHLFLSGVSRGSPFETQGCGVAAQRQARRSACKEGRQAMNREEGKLRDVLVVPLEEATRTAEADLSRVVEGESGREPRAPRPKRGVGRSRNPRGVFQKVPGKNSPCWIRFTDAQGKFRREVAGSKSAAIALYFKRKNKALEGQKLPETLRRRIVPFSELCEDTADYIRKRYARPQHDIGRLENIKKWFGSRGAESITSLEVEAALSKAKEEGNWSASSHNHHHTLLSLTFRLGIRNGKVEKNPVRGIRREPENDSRVRFLTADEEKRLREAIRSNPAWHEHEPELSLALSTGLRRGSMYIDLVWENVALDTRVASVPRTKNGDPVHIPLNADAMKALMVFHSRGDGTGRVVRNAVGEPLNYPTHWFVPAVRAAKIRDYKWHDNRHTYASRLRQTGTPLGNISELLGHKGLAMTRRYAHLSISNLRDAVARIATDTPVAPSPVEGKSEVAYVQ